jgi:hypothetical protein
MSLQDIVAVIQIRVPYRGSEYARMNSYQKKETSPRFRCQHILQNCQDMLHRVVFLLKIPYAFSVPIGEKCIRCSHHSAEVERTVAQSYEMAQKEPEKLISPGEKSDDDAHGFSTMVQAPRTACLDMQTSC